nr:adenylylsulfatase HINT3 [Tanacetum cinerariifolium]
MFAGNALLFHGATNLSLVVAAMCSKVPYIARQSRKPPVQKLIFKETHIHIIPHRARDCLWASERLQRHPLKSDQEVLHLVDNIKQQSPFLISSYLC